MITQADIAKEPTALIYRISYLLLKELIYVLEAGTVQDQADFARELRKLAKDAKISDSED
jgi:hypothetical protein